MNIDRRLVGFGLFLITIGSVMVALRQGLLSDDAARQAWTLWPLIPVGVGLSIVLAGRPGASIGGLIVAITFGAMIGGVLAAGWLPGVGFCGSERAGGTPFPGASDNLAASSRVTIEQSCGALTVGTVAGSTWSLSGRSGDGRPPAVVRDGNGLRIRTPDGGPFDIGGANSWTVALPRDSTLHLTISVNGGESLLNLAGAHIGRLAIDANAGSVDLDLREVAAVTEVALDVNFGSATVRFPNLSVAGTLSVNAGSTAICIPAGAGLRVELDSVTASNDFASQGLIETKDGWETPGFAGAEIRIDLQLDANAGSVALDPPRTCAG